MRRQLRDLQTETVITERHGESRPRHFLRAIVQDGINPNVAAALAAVSQPDG